MKTKKILTIFYIFILLSSYTLSNICENVRIRKKYYDLKGIKEEGDYLTNSVEINKIHYEAFTFIYLDKYEYELKHDIIEYYIKALKSEESKIHLFSLIVFADKIFSSIGMMSLNTKSLDYINFLDLVKKAVENESGLNIEKKKKISSEIAKAKSDLDGYLNKYVNNPISDITASGVSIGIGYLTSHLMTKYAATLSNPAFGLVWGVFSLISGLGISKWWNSSADKEIKMYEEMLKKKYILLADLYNQIKNLKWVENNIVFTGLSLIPDCFKSEVKFDFEDGIKYQHPDQIELNMIRRTCILNSDKCKDKKECMKNVREYIKLLSDQRKALGKDLPLFDKESCTLKKNIDDYINDL